MSGFEKGRCRTKLCREWLSELCFDGYSAGAATLVNDERGRKSCFATTSRFLEVDQSSMSINDVAFVCYRAKVVEVGKRETEAEVSYQLPTICAATALVPSREPLCFLSKQKPWESLGCCY